MPDHAGWLGGAIAELKRTLAAASTSAAQRQVAERLLGEFETELLQVRPSLPCCATNPPTYFNRYDHS